MLPGQLSNLKHGSKKKELTRTQTDNERERERETDENLHIKRTKPLSQVVGRQEGGKRSR